MNWRRIVIFLFVLVLLIPLFFRGFDNKSSSFVFKATPEAIAFERMLTTEEMNADLIQLEESIKYTYPMALGRMPEYIRQAIEEAKETISKPMPLYKFSVIVAQMLSQLNDGHTYHFYMAHGPEIPYVIKIIDDKFYILTSPKKANDGKEILEIGGVSMQTIFNAYKAQFSAENTYWTYECFERRYIELEKLQELGAELTSKGGIEVKVKDDKGIKTIRLSQEDYIYDQFTDAQRFKVLYPKYDAYETVTGRANSYSFSIDKNTNTAHFVLIECLYDEQYALFLKKMFDSINQAKIDNIVVDLRGNGGGDNQVAYAFLDYLSDSKDQMPVFDGNVYVLIDHASFSGAVNFATLISDRHIGIVIGQPSGGKPTASGEVKAFVLPNTQLEYNIATKFAQRVDTSKNEEDALYPDDQTHYDIWDYINQRDRDMEKVMLLIKENEN
ncbi:S41 family peptidase [Fusibacter sp. 3D3]|uniref:S41 family peptidase n=1 Tax=Fusibacter sp. 3D3 TaxID=1048380 RepID=UPI000852A1FA|nr:S41 family peptidase [Fusibacter sp. 3D3]GAU75472.1 peptidase S41 family [Fusibacter sp. 3D3]